MAPQKTLNWDPLLLISQECLNHGFIVSTADSNTLDCRHAMSSLLDACDINTTTIGCSCGTNVTRI